MGENRAEERKTAELDLKRAMSNQTTSCQPSKSQLCLVSATPIQSDSNQTSPFLSDTRNVSSIAPRFGQSGINQTTPTLSDTGNVSSTAPRFGQSGLNQTRPTLSDAGNVSSLAPRFGQSGLIQTRPTLSDIGNVSSIAPRFSQSGLNQTSPTLWDTGNVSSTAPRFGQSGLTQTRPTLSDTGNVSSIAPRFGQSGSNQTSPTLWDTENVSSIAHRFGQSGLNQTSPALSDTGNVSSIAPRFGQSGSNQTSPTVSDTENVSSIAPRFGQSGLNQTSPALSDTGNVSSIAPRFGQSGSNQTSPTVSDTENVSSIAPRFGQSGSNQTSPTVSDTENVSSTAPRFGQSGLNQTRHALSEPENVSSIAPSFGQSGSNQTSPTVSDTRSEFSHSDPASFSPTLSSASYSSSSSLKLSFSDPVQTSPELNDTGKDLFSASSTSLGNSMSSSACNITTAASCQLSSRDIQSDRLSLRHLSTSLNLSGPNPASDGNTGSQVSGADVHLPDLLIAHAPVQDQTWTEMDIEKEVFVQTSAYEDAFDLFSTYNRLILNGPPGSGKRTLGRSLLRHAENKNMTSFIIKTFGEWREHGGGKKATTSRVFLLDHIFGKVVLTKDEIDTWQQVFDVMEQFSREGRVKLVFTFYPHILRALREIFPNCRLFSDLFEVKLQKETSREVKKEMLRKHLFQDKSLLQLLNFHMPGESLDPDEEERLYLKIEESVLSIDDSDALFPTCCKRFKEALSTYVPLGDFSHCKRFIYDCAKVFSRPSLIYKEYISKSLCVDVQFRENVIAAFCSLLAKVGLNDQKKVKEFCSKFGFTCSATTLRETLMDFRETVVTADCLHFVNRHAYEGTALALAQRQPILVIRAVDWLFLVKRCGVPSKDSGRGHVLTPYFLEISRVSVDKENTRDEYKALVERMARGLISPHEMVSAVQHSVLEAEQFCNDLKSMWERNDNLCSILTESRDSSHNCSLLFWSLFQESPFFTQWLFKTVIKEGRRKSLFKQDLILAVLACCMLNGKVSSLEMILKYWKKATSEKVEMLLEGKSLGSDRLVIPLPNSRESLSKSVKRQLKYLEMVLRDCSSESKIDEPNHLMLSNPSDIDQERRNADLNSVSGNDYVVAMRKTDSERTHTCCGEASRVKRKSITISQPPLLLAVQYNNSEVVEFLAKKYSNMLSVTGSTEQTALHVAALYDRCEIMKKLLHYQDLLPLTAQDSLGNTALHIACDRGNVDVAKLLMSEDPFLAKISNTKGIFPADFVAKIPVLNAIFQNVL